MTRITLNQHRSVENSACFETPPSRFAAQIDDRYAAAAVSWFKTLEVDLGQDVS